jgi:hypothetical protein
MTALFPTSPIVAIACVLALAPFEVRAQDAPTPEQYVARVGGDSKIVPSGQLKIDGTVMNCGSRPTVLDNTLDDYAAAYPGFLIINPRLMSKVPTPVKKWIFSHECGHQFRGPDEDTADCFAVQRGRRQGWLAPEGLEAICQFISPARGTNMHYAGPQRCESMRKCYADPEVR